MQHSEFQTINDFYVLHKPTEVVAKCNRAITDLVMHDPEVPETVKDSVFMLNALRDNASKLIQKGGSHVK